MDDAPFPGSGAFVFLSPHPDDAALSCGATIARLRRAGHEVTILTVCLGSPPPPPLSSLAQTFHRAMGPAEDLVAARRAEDLLAARSLRCRLIQLSVPDAIYRAGGGKWYYETLPALFGDPHPDDTAPFLAVQAALSPFLDQGASVVAPLGLGGHVDHRETRRAAEALARDLVYYEEFPYGDPAYPGLPGVASLNAHPPNDAFLQGLSPRVATCSTEDLDRKIEACARYGTQLSLVFRTEAEMRERITDFALRFGLQEPGERFWMPTGDSGAT